MVLACAKWVSFSDTAGSCLPVGWQGVSVLLFFFFFFSKFPLYFFPFCFKLAFARILCDFSPSSEVLKLLLKLPLKKAFSELTMEKSILLSLSYILMCWAQSVGQRGQKPGEFFLCQISMELLLGNMGVAMVSQSLSPPSPGTDEDSC